MAELKFCSSLHCVQNLNSAFLFKHVLDSDKSRSSYYEVISNQSWGKKENYDLCLNYEIGNDKIVKVICEYIEYKKEQ